MTTKKQLHYGLKIINIHFCDIKWIPSECPRLFHGHHLNVKCPRRIFASMNCVVKISRSIVWVGTSEFQSYIWGQILNFLVRLKTESKNIKNNEFFTSAAHIETILCTCTHPVMEFTPKRFTLSIN